MPFKSVFPCYRTIQSPLRQLLLLLGSGLPCGFFVNTAVADSATAPVVVSGTVADAATKQQILERIASVYGNRVVDQIKVAPVKTPPQWSQTVLDSINPSLRSISQGRLNVNGSAISYYGSVASDADRNRFDANQQPALPGTYRIKNALNVVAPEQMIVDKALANRIIEFESGSTTLTPIGLGILDEIATALKRIGNKNVVITGHTDNQGKPEDNMKLSQGRADAVKQYLVGRGIPAETMTTRGEGAVKPVADNKTDEGRKRNRRIEFVVR